MRKRIAFLIVIGLAIVSRRVEAGCTEEAAELRAQLSAEARRARIWNIGWGAAFGVAAVGAVALAVTETRPFGTFTDDDRDLYYVAAGKATIGLAARLVIPLRIDVPAAAAEPCADAIALRAAVAEAGRRERRMFWLGHLGGLAVNLAGVVVLAERRSFGIGALSFAIGYPVGLASSYTQPRRSWHLWRERRASWTAIVGPRGVWLAGEF